MCLIRFLMLYLTNTAWLACGLHGWGWMSDGHIDLPMMMFTIVSSLKSYFCKNVSLLDVRLVLISICQKTIETHDSSHRFHYEK